MDKKLKNKYFSLLGCSALLLGSLTLFSCKSTEVSTDDAKDQPEVQVSEVKDEKQEKQQDIYKKIVHPREYIFDFAQAGSKVSLKKSKGTELLSGKIDFTEFVEDDLPQAGDKLIFYYDGTADENIYGDVVASIVVPNVISPERKLATDLQEKELIHGKISFILDSNVEDVVISINCKSAQKKSKISFKFNETEVKPTDISEEIKAEKKAKRKHFVIEEVKTEITDDYAPKINKPKEPEAPKIIVKTAEEIAAEKAAKEAAEKAEKERIALEERKKAEKLEIEKQQKELLEHQKKLEETIQTITNTDVKRYEKEYLNDYAITEYTLDDEEEEKPETKAYGDPDKADEFGRTLLMEAAKEGNDWQIKALLSSGADVNLKDKDGWTALMYGVRYQENLHCVNLLIEAGADIKATNNFGMSALVLASNYNNNPEILKELLSYYSPTDKDVLKSFILVLTENTSTEYMQIVKVNLFLDLSVPLNSFYEGKTPLMYAAESGNSTKVIKLLLDSNSITSIRSTEGKTAFDYAKENPKLKHDNIYWSLNNK